MADTKTVEKTIQHALLRYTDEHGATQLAFRGQTVQIPEDQVERLESLGTFTQEVGEEPTNNGTMTDTLTADSSDEEFQAWVRSATNDDVSALLSENPNLAERILTAETQVKDGQPRAGVEKAVQAAVESRSQ